MSPINSCNQGHLGQFICWGDSQLGSLCTSCTLFFLLHILNLFVNIKSYSILWIIHLFCRCLLCRWKLYVQLWPLEKYDMPRDKSYRKIRFPGKSTPQLFACRGPLPWDHQPTHLISDAWTWRLEHINRIPKTTKKDINIQRGLTILRPTHLPRGCTGLNWTLERVVARWKFQINTAEWFYGVFLCIELTHDFKNKIRPKTYG